MSEIRTTGAFSFPARLLSVYPDHLQRLYQAAHSLAVFCLFMDKYFLVAAAL